MTPLLVPIRTVPGLNAREHWRARSTRVRKEREAVGWVLKGQPMPAVPLTVRLTRVSPSSGCDDDNLAGALKGVRDAVAAWLGIDDRRQQQVRYVYAQHRGPWGVEIEWLPPASGAQYVLGEIVEAA